MKFSLVLLTIVTHTSVNISSPQLVSSIVTVFNDVASILANFTKTGKMGLSISAGIRTWGGIEGKIGSLLAELCSPPPHPRGFGV